MLNVQIDLEERIIKVNGETATHVYDLGESPTGESGGMRDVYLTSTHVVKVGGIGEAYLKIDPDDQKHFAKTVLVDINQEWLIQERIDCVPNLCLKQDYDVIQKLCEKYNIGDVSWTFDTWKGFGVPERNTHNWITDKNGIPVIFDYEDNRRYHLR